MPRKKTKPPCETLTRTIAVRLTEDELTDLDQLVEAQNRTIRSLGIANVITRANFIRNLVHKEIKPLHEEPLPEPEAPPKKRRKHEKIQVTQFET